MQNQESLRKKGLLVVSFGTTHEETLAVTIDVIEEDLAKAFPDRVLYRGWTSRMVVRRSRERGFQVNTLEEALIRMREDGIRDLLVQPTHIMRGAENDRMMEVLTREEDQFERIRTGLPLLASEEDLRQLARILTGEYAPGADRALLLMGHGSAKKAEANRIYEEMETAFRRGGCENAFVATVEGTPRLQDAIEKIPAEVTKVILAPMMIVAGDHAKNDMAGDGPDSWKTQLEAKGFQVKPVLRGLGEYPKVREMLLHHAEEAREINARK